MRRPACVAAALLSAVSLTAQAQRRADVRCDPGDTEVRSLRFTGNRAHSDYVLERGIATTPSTWWRRTFRVLGKRYCLDSLAATVVDSARLSDHYRSTGYPDVQVRPVIRRLGPRAVDVTYRIDEGEPMVIDSLGVRWTDAFGIELAEPIPDARRYVTSLPVALGGRYDFFAIEAARDTIRRRLRDRGYPQADVLRDFTTDVEAHRAEVTFKVSPGPRAWIGSIDIAEPIAPGGARPRIDTARVRRVLGIREGQLYSERALEGVRRGLFLTEAFQFVAVGIDSSSLTDPADSLVTVHVTLAESQLLATRAALGWGNLDCIRTQVNHTNYNFLGQLRRLDLAGRLSKVGFAAPLDWGKGDLCGNLRDDPFSDTLNYYVSATLSQASLFGARIVPSLSVYSERRSEYKAFLRETPFGLIGSAQQGVGTTFPMTWSYQLEYGRTVAQPAFFCAVFNVCEGEARRRLEAGTRSASVGWSGTRSRVAGGSSQSSGSILRLELRHASPLVGSTQDASFNRASADATWYTPIGTGTLVFRVRAGAVLGSRLDLTGSPRFIPLQERLYAGGPNSVRGYRQNELGPAIYLPALAREIPIPGNDTLVFLEADPGTTSERTVPTGGDNVVVANAEWRFRSPAFPELMQWALFVDAGQVWNRGRAGTGVDYSDIRVTPGFGVRVFTPVGPIRVDVGYNGYRRQPGPAYLTSVGSGSGNLLCVSPGNDLRVLKLPGGGYERQVDEGDCPASYEPRRGASFLSRLTFQFSIGQPF